MPDNNLIEGNVTIGGRLAVGSISLPLNSLKSGLVDLNYPFNKDEVQPRIIRDYFQAAGVAVVSITTPIHIARAAGLVNTSFKAALSIACIGAATVVVSIKKNGTTVTGTPITFTNADAAYAVKTGVLSSGAVLAGDVFEVVVVATAGGGTIGQGLCVSVDFQENNF